MTMGEVVTPLTDRDATDWKPPTGVLNVRKTLIDVYPYHHVDVWAWDDGTKYVFGVPYSETEGMAFYRIESNGDAVRTDRPDINVDPPVCPFHDRECVYTKEFSFATPTRHQFKCPECYLTRYIDGDVVVGDGGE